MAAQVARLSATADVAGCGRRPGRGARPLSAAVTAQEAADQFPRRTRPTSTPKRAQRGAITMARNGRRNTSRRCSDRNQPVVTFNRIKRKINTVVGVLEKLRQDPKAYPRTPQPHGEKGAELATQVLLYALGWNWETHVGRGRPAGGDRRHCRRRDGAGAGRQGRPRDRAHPGRQPRLFLRHQQPEARFFRQPLRGHDALGRPRGGAISMARQGRRARREGADLGADALPARRRQAPEMVGPQREAAADRRPLVQARRRLVLHDLLRRRDPRGGREPVRQREGREHLQISDVLAPTSTTTTTATVSSATGKARRTRSTSAARRRCTSSTPAAPSWSAARSTTSS